MADLATMIGDIEDALGGELEARGLAVTDFDIADDADAVRCPAANISFWTGDIVPVTMHTKFRMDAEFYVVLVVENLRREKERRKNVYPLVMGALQILCGQTLYKDGAPLTTKPVKPRGVKKVLDTKSRIAFAVRLFVPFYFAALSFDEAASLLEIALQYRWKPGDDETDFEDIVDVS